jgi:hypothetical protein
MSGLEPITDSSWTSRHVGFVPGPDSCVAAKAVACAIRLILTKGYNLICILFCRVIFLIAIFADLQVRRRARGLPAPLIVLSADSMMAYGDRKSERVDFERGIPVYLMGIDGTWRRDCTMIDVSQTGARLRIEGSFEGVDLKEFFLLLSSTGLAFRRCRMVRVAGDQIGVQFLAREKAQKKSMRQNSADETS